MAEQHPSYPVGVISFAPEERAYRVDSDSYEALLRQNGKNAASAERRLRLLDKARSALVQGGDTTAIVHAITEELDGRPATV